MTDLDSLTERGCRDMLASIAECRVPLAVRLRAADAEVASLALAAARAQIFSTPRHAL